MVQAAVVQALSQAVLAAVPCSAKIMTMIFTDKCLQYHDGQSKEITDPDSVTSFKSLFFFF